MWEITRGVHPSSPGPGAIWEERNNDNPLVLDVSDSEIALDPASCTLYVAFGTFEHSFGGELQPLAKMRDLDIVEYRGLNAYEVRSDGAWNGRGVGYSDSWADSVAFIARTMRIGWESDFLSVLRC